MKLNEKKSLKMQITEKLEVLENRRSEFYRLSSRCYRSGLEYQHFTQSSGASAIAILFVVAFIISIVTMTPIFAFGIDIGTIICATASIYYHNRMARKRCKDGVEFITFCFYTKRLLNEICGQIALVDEDIKAAKVANAERDRKAAEAKEEKIRVARALRGPFDELFEIVRKELDGEVRGSGKNGELLDTDTEAELLLPVISDDYLRYDWWTYWFTDDGLNKLTFQISQLRPVMNNYHSLKKSLDTTVPAEQ